MKEETLSDNIYNLEGKIDAQRWIRLEEVKDFIKKLKEEADKEGENNFVDISCGEYEFDREKFKRFLDKLAGNELVE